MISPPMFMRTPQHCRPRAYERLHGQLPVIETSDGLLHGALAIAMHESGAFDPDAVEGQLQQIAEAILERTTRVTHVEAVLAHAHEVLFDEMGFAGNREDYDHPDNSYLPCVLQTRRGLPITLVLLYKLVLERVGVTVCGINTPGHFLAAVDDADRRLLIDVFDRGRLLSRDETVVLIKLTSGVTWSPPEAPFPVATHRQWLVRMCANLMHAFGHRGQPADAAAMRELIHLLNLGG
jgi:regulator of sirC expression with transglutaminase-like and TPR domain